jgi:hypothetical protein
MKPISIHAVLRQMITCTAGLIISATAFTQAAITPEVQQTLRQYAGKDAKPVVPVAMLNAKEPLGDEAARWLSSQRQQKLISYSLRAGGNNYFGTSADSVAVKFKAALDAGSIIYFDDADALYGKPGLSAEQQALAAKLAAESKKFPNAVLMKCTTEECWFALAKAGFGIVKLDYQ